MEIYWLWLAALKGIGPVTIRKLVQRLGSPQAVYEANREDLLCLTGLKAGMIEKVSGQHSLDTAQRIYEDMHRSGIKLLDFTSPHFPSYLNSFPGLPAILYYRGSLPQFTASVGIVGSRRCTSYGKEVTTEIATYLGQHGITVVSGLAKGIDSYAHTACLKARGYTLAFVANGVNLCYPPEHQTLMDEIITHGAVISAHPPGTRPRPEYFPYRNELLAAWVDKLVVVEAAERSGALITAEYAKKYNRKVFAVPNNIYSPEGIGVNRLLLKGADAYLEPEQLLDRYGENESRSRESTKANKCNNTAIGSIEKAKRTPDLKEMIILERLEKPQEMSSFLDLFHDDLGSLFEQLCQMEIEGKVVISGEKVRKVGNGVQPRGLLNFKMEGLH